MTMFYEYVLNDYFYIKSHETLVSTELESFHNPTPIIQCIPLHIYLYKCLSYIFGSFPVTLNS